MTKAEIEHHEMCALDRKDRRRKQRFWMFCLNIFFMSVIGFILLSGLDNGPAETGIFMSFGSLITLNTAYLFGEVWEDLTISKTSIKVS